MLPVFFPLVFAANIFPTSTAIVSKVLIGIQLYWLLCFINYYYNQLINIVFHIGSNTVIITLCLYRQKLCDFTANAPLFITMLVCLYSG